MAREVRATVRDVRRPVAERRADDMVARTG